MKVSVRVHANDPLNPLEYKLTREQVWRGLMRRVEEPELFIPGLAGCRFLERAEQSVLRELKLGEQTIVERVTWTAAEALRFETVGGTSNTRSHLDIELETPDGYQLILHFRFHTDLAEQLSQSGHDYHDVLTNAYIQNAQQTVLTIRAMFEPPSAREFTGMNLGV